MRIKPLKLLRQSLGMAAARPGVVPPQLRPVDYLADEESLYARALRQRLAAVDFRLAPDIPERELLQWRRLSARAALLAAAGYDLQAIGSEQLVGAAQVSEQKHKVFVSRCEYDLEVNDALLRPLAGNLRRDYYWYVTNATARTARVICLPLGLNDYCSFREFHGFAGDTRHLLELRPRADALRRGVLKCFNPDNDAAGRQKLAALMSGWEALRDVPLARDAEGFRRYLGELAQSEFCVCPRGVGIDTHRFWEALYMGAIPILVKSDLLACQQGLPMLLLARWEDLRGVDLAAESARIRAQHYDLGPLTVAHWLDRAVQSATTA